VSEARSTQARARECPLSVDERVAHLRALMDEQLWPKGGQNERVRELAELWGVSESTVRRHVAEASRQIRQALTDPDAQAVRIEQLLDRAEVEALGEGGAKGGSAAVRIAQLRARLAGLLAPVAAQPPPTTTDSKADTKPFGFTDEPLAPAPAPTAPPSKEGP
jgi:hypothetical protein